MLCCYLPMISSADWTCDSLWCCAFHEACGAGWSIAERIWGGLSQMMRRRIIVKPGFWVFWQKNAFVKELSGEFLQVNQRVHHKITSNRKFLLQGRRAGVLCLWLAACLCVRILGYWYQQNIISIPVPSHRENKNILPLSAVPLPRQQPSRVQETSVLESRARIEIRKR